MPGRMGNERVTLQNLPVLLVNNDLGIVVVKGSVAGPKGCIVKIQDAVKEGAATAGVHRPREECSSRTVS